MEIRDDVLIRQDIICDTLISAIEAHIRLDSFLLFNIFGYKARLSQYGEGALVVEDIDCLDIWAYPKLIGRKLLIKKLRALIDLLRVFFSTKSGHNWIFVLIKCTIRIINSRYLGILKAESL